MNPTPSSPADDPPPATGNTSADADAVVAPPAQQVTLTPKARKHVELLDDLLRSFDALVYIELSALYHLDCTFGLLILRTLVQLFLLTARPPGFPDSPTRSALGGIIGSNILCILLHLLNKRPEAGEATRHYLHGGLLIDFVGQLGPTSKWRLFGMDMLVLVLQVVMLGLAIEKRRVQNAEKQTLSSTQDLEAEEAGVIRSRTMRNEGPESNEGIEMQELLAEASAEDEIGRDESNIHSLDEFYTGSTVLARLNVVETIATDVTSSATGSEATSGGVSLPGLFLRWRSLG